MNSLSRASSDRDDSMLEVDCRTVNVESMNSLVGFDIVIVCTGNEKQALYWQERLQAGRKVIIGAHVKVLSVYEEWPGGAGNALGTLYAWRNACVLAKTLYNFDLQRSLREESISVGLFHTAGRGTRLAPLPGSENNNKPGVKLGTTINLNGEKMPITILEAVIKQAGVYAQSRKGRLSVFWGDQVFIPSEAVDYEPTHHIDILCRLGPMLTKQEWIARGMEKYYGLIAVNRDNNAAQFEKVSYEMALEMLKELGDIAHIGISLGSFSVSHQMLDALLVEFEDELKTKTGHFDADPHIWMPLSLSCKSYTHLMSQKGVDESTARAHHARIKAMQDRFIRLHGIEDMGLLGAVNIGTDAFWWDYGQLRLYFLNNMLMTQDTYEADLFRKFLGITSRVRHAHLNDVDVDSLSVVSSCVLQQGKVRNSVLSNVRCGNINAEYCILINVVAKFIKAPPGSLIYNVIEEDEAGIDLEEGGVLAGVLREDGSQMKMRSMTHIDGGKAWKDAVEGNLYSFEHLYEMNEGVDVHKAEQQMRKKGIRLWRKMGKVDLESDEIVGLFNIDQSKRVILLSVFALGLSFSLGVLVGRLKMPR